MINKLIKIWLGSEDTNILYYKCPIKVKKKNIF